VTSQQLGFSPSPARFRIEQEAVQVEDHRTETPREGGDRLPTAGASWR
jgi:hypothetical protein